MLSVNEAAKLNHVTTKAIFYAISIQKLKASKIDGRWKVNIDDLRQYQLNKYNRRLSTINGFPLIKDDEYSIKDVADLLSLSYNHVYYKIKSGKIMASRKRSSWIINKNDLDIYKMTYHKFYKEII